VKTKAPLFQKLDSTDENEREHGCMAIAHLATEGAESLEQLLQHGAVECLAARLADHITPVAVAAAGALTNIVAEGGEAAAQAILGGGALGAIVAQLQRERSRPADAAAVDEASAELLAGRERARESLTYQMLAVLHSLCQNGPRATEALSQPAVVDTVVRLLSPPAGADAADFVRKGSLRLTAAVNLLHALTEENPAVALQLGVEVPAPRPRLLRHLPPYSAPLALAPAALLVPPALRPAGGCRYRPGRRGAPTAGPRGRTPRYSPWGGWGWRGCRCWPRSAPALLS
jgi:hypothetical protein